MLVAVASVAFIPTPAGLALSLRQILILPLLVIVAPRSARITVEAPSTARLPVLVTVPVASAPVA
ncbi:hypothetical protein D3C80_1958080 [compost metagenome]